MPLAKTLPACEVGWRRDDSCRPVTQGGQMPSKLRIKMGRLEFEYEGEADFSQEQIKDLFSHMEGLSKVAGISLDVPATENHGDDGDDGDDASSDLEGMHTETIAALLKVKSASELALAAAVHFLKGGKKVFTRIELLGAMKSATSYYNENMAGNHSKTMTTLTTNRSFNRIGNGSYSLTSANQSELERKIAGQG
jgi:hypothetical protein